MAKSNKQINKESNSPGHSMEDSPAVLVYRMGQLEVAVKDGFLEHNLKLDSLTNAFATKEEMSVVQKRMDNWVWFGRAITVAALTSLGLAITNYLSRK